MLLNSGIKDKYNEWKEKAVADFDLLSELECIEHDKDEINERFYKDLEFGTGGFGA